ncbi:amidohydrolase [Clostridiaceae bacterium M8S5]|nr:amidohydrolase [Clostridiaceae bacterium M8S5]
MKAYINGNIITMNSSSEISDYFIEENGVFKEVGTKFKPDDFTGEIIDLNGKTVTPGFTDGHMHILSYATKKERQVDLTGVRSLKELVDITKKFIQDKNIKKGQWVVGVGWNHTYFENSQMPDRIVLDEISKEHPIILIRACYHIGVVNTKALELANITMHTKDVEGGHIDREESGYPTGVLRENAITLVEDLVPTVNDIDTIKKLLLVGLHDSAKLGLTTVCIDDFSYVEDRDMLLKAYRDLNKEGKLPINIVLQLRAERVEDVHRYRDMGLKSHQKDNRITIGPIKIIGDGSLGSCTAAMIEPYENEGDNRGILIETQEHLDKLVYESFTNDFDVAIHAIGDRTMQTILNSYRKYKDIYTQKGLTPSIIHCQINNQKIIDDMKKLNVVANIQPIFVCTDWRIVKERVGETREKYSYCWNTFVKNGILCVGGSDAPIETFNPLYGIYAAITRRDMEGLPKGGWLPEEKVSIFEAIKMFTINSAYYTHQESERGSIEIGKKADFVVLDNEISMLYEDYNGSKVEQTYVEGKIASI